jgi:hypothetical protein
MTPGQFRIMMYRRLGLNIPTIADGLKCNCSNRPIIDKKGIHIVTVCKKGQTRHQIHSRMNQELAAMVRFSQLYCRQEPYEVYRVNDPENGKRPDLEIRGLGETLLYTDVSITEPVNSSLTLVNSTQVCRSAKVRERHKVSNYEAVSVQAGAKFYPLVFETYGAWGPGMVEFFDVIISHASEARGVRKDILATYWRRRIAVTLHKAIASEILQRIGRCRAGVFRDESNYELVIQEQSYVRSNQVGESEIGSLITP